jgi:hypothetical protein
MTSFVQEVGHSDENALPGPARIGGPFSSEEGNSLKRTLPGWGRSADRTRLHVNSLPTGNFTGNFAFLRL